MSKFQMAMMAISMWFSDKNPIRKTTTAAAMSVFEKAKRNLHSVKAHQAQAKKMADSAIETALDAQWAGVQAKDAADKEIADANAKLVVIGKLLNGK